jgi:mRNA interferase RelE/StbE
VASEYRVEIETAAAKQILRLQRHEQIRIKGAIDALAVDPRPHGCTKLSGTNDSYRVRVGVFHIVYVIEDGLHVVNITRVAHRKEVYKR